MPLPRGIIFDLDGTLTLPQPWAFALMRRLLDIPSQSPILPHLSTLPPAARDESYRTVRRIERLAMRRMSPTSGLRPLLSYLRLHSIPTAVLTRNIVDPVRWLEEKWLGGFRFDEVMTREEEGVRAKPSEDGVVEIARRWGRRAGEVWMVGDSEDDVCAGERAGAKTVLVKRRGQGEGGEWEGSGEGWEGRADWCVERLDELIPVLEEEKGLGGGSVIGS